MKSIDKLAFTSELVLERTTGTTPIGMYETEMELFELGLCVYQIEWRCNPLVGGIRRTRDGYQEEHIGIWTRLVPQVTAAAPRENKCDDCCPVTGCPTCGPCPKHDGCTQELTDYDGIMGWLPTQAIELLERNGIAVPQDFREEE